MKRLASFIIALLVAALLPYAAVQAAELENVILTAEKGKAKVEMRLPDDSQGVSTLKLRIKVEGDTAKLNQNEPFAFEAGGEISSRLLETRFQANTGYLTIYISDTSKITDSTYFELGAIVPNSADDSEYELTFSVPEDGLEFVDGTGTLNEDTEVVSSAVAVKVNAADETPDDNPGETPDGGKDDPSDTDPDKKPSGTPSGSNGGNNTASGSKDQNLQGNKAADSRNQSVQTGDNSNLLLYLALAGISAAGIGAAVVLRRK